MKTDPIEDIKKQVADFSKQVAEIESLNSRQAVAETELARLNDSGDLTDDKVLDSISRLQLFVKLLPARIEAREQSVMGVKASLLTVLDNFCGNDIRKRFHNIAALARARAESRLKPLFQDNGDLVAAVNNTPEMKEVSGFWNKEGACSVGGLIHAEHSKTAALGKKILALWKEGEEIEARLQPKADHFCQQPK